MTHWIDVTAQVQTIHVGMPQGTQPHEHSETKVKISVKYQFTTLRTTAIFKKKKDKKIKYCKEYFYTSLQTRSWNFHVPSGACHPAKPSLPGILAFPGACKEYGDGGKF